MGNVVLTSRVRGRMRRGGREHCCRLTPTLCILLCLAALGTHAAVDAFPAVLTDNAMPDEPAIATGVTYTAEPAFTNPADSSGRRLLDRDRPWDDWNVTVGVNQPAQTVLFDFGAPYRFSRCEVRMTHEQRPARIDVAVGETATGPWQPLGVITPEEQQAPAKGWYEVSAEQSREGRYVKLEFAWKTWGWYVKEVKLWGVRADEPGPEVTMPLIRSEGALTLVQDGSPAGSILLDAAASSRTVRGARFLQDTIRRMSGAVLPLRRADRDWQGARIFVGAAGSHQASVPQGPDNPQRYRVVVGDRDVMLVGNDGAEFDGTLQAVHHLLGILGYGWFGPDDLYQVVPQQRTLQLSPMDVDETPDFVYRNVWNVPESGRTAWRLGGPSMQFGHAYDRLFPAKEYASEHPEYYALVGGVRQAERAQLCFSNRELQRATAAKARAYFDAHPDARGFSLSANDCGGFCECARCAALGENPGAQSLSFANAVARDLARTHPGRDVCFLAYWYTFAAPTAMKAEPNVMVMVVNQACHAHALDDPDCPHNRAWSENFEAWCQTGARMAIYEWYIPGCSHKHWRQLPWISTDVAFRNLRYWRSKGVRWVTYESQKAYEDGLGYPRRWPLYYIAAQGLWNCDADPRQVLAEACERLYGPAGPAMTAMFSALAEALEETNVHGSIWNMPAAKAVFRPDVRDTVRGHASEALALARDNPIHWRRVAREVALWSESEEVLDQLPDLNQFPIDARQTNGGVWFTDKAELTGALIRDIVGLGPWETVQVVMPNGDTQRLQNERTYDVTKGLRLVP